MINSIGRSYIVCAGKNKCDWNTVVKAYKESKIDLDLHLIGGREEQFENINGVVQIPYLPVNDFIKQVQGAEFCILPLEPVPFSFGQMRLLQQMALRKCVIVSDAPSIMDYARNNFVAQPGDVERGVKLTPPVLGVYDIHAINWGLPFDSRYLNSRSRKTDIGPVDSRKGRRPHV